MMSTTAIDYERGRRFAGKVVGDLAGVSASLLAIIGDRLGLFRALDEGGPATSRGARCAAERYAREWLYGLHGGGYGLVEEQLSRVSQRICRTSAVWA